MSVDVQHEQFVRLLVANQRRIQAYIFTLVFDWATAEELTQDTCVILWQKFDQFEPGSDFASWACSVAHYMVLKWREKQARSREVASGDFVRMVADYQRESADELEDRRHALAHCLEGLRGKDRDLLRQRYEGNRSAKDISRKLGRPIGSIYQSLHRVRRMLHACIQQRLAQEEAS